jgi:hypothetical protein
MMKQRKQLQIKAKSEISTDKKVADYPVPASATSKRECKSARLALFLFLRIAPVS